MPFNLREGDFDAIIFDCDGTLVDTAPTHFIAYREAFGSMGISVDWDWYESLLGLTPESLLDRYESEFGLKIPCSRAELIQSYSRAFRRNVDQLREIPFVAKVARAWNRIVPLAVASNGERENVLASLSATRLLDLFSTVVTAEDVHRGKPAPDLFLEAANRLGVAAKRCLVFEDSDEGLTAASVAGMRSFDIRKFLTPGRSRVLQLIDTIPI
jgi:beta-phosphoglucomutase-like phosphatase (HAD superfamily)